MGISGYLICTLAVWCCHRKTSPTILEFVLLLMRKIDARWRIGYVTNGYYTTKSTYRLLLKVVEAATPGTSNSAAQKLFWQELWSLNVPNKICHFLWRVANDSLPTKKNLQKRNITQDPTYDRCRDGIEDGIHAIWGCQWLNKCGGNWKIAEST